MRQLAAIMFADMSGYTALMQQNEQQAIEKRRRLREVLEATVAAHRGKILQHVGDGSLSIFNSAIEGVRCAVSIQRTLQAPPQVPLRIGIHTGDVIIEGELIYGDGVNIASRIESLAVPGSVLISEKVFDEIQNQQNLSAREMGFFEFKHVLRPVRVYAIDVPGIVVPARDTLKGKTTTPTNRLAVLPFVNMSADPENEYFSDGITEELLNALTRVDGLQVTSRTSSFAFKGKNTDIRDIGIQLNVDKVLEGSVRKAGNRVRITAQLISSADGYHLWSETYDRNLTDIFEVQDEISGIIADKLRMDMQPGTAQTNPVKTSAHNLDAYNLYLKGLHFYHKITPADTRKAITYFEEAIALEPGYAQAYAMAAAGYTFLGATGQMPADNAFEIVHRYSDTAISLDPALSTGYAARGSAYLLYDWKWKEAYQALRKAIELNPAATGAHQLLSFYYMITGQSAAAVDIMEQAYKVDPLSLLVNKSLADAYLFAGRTDESLRQAEALLEMYPGMGVALELKGWSVGVRGDWQKAATLFEESRRASGQHPLKGQFAIGCAYANAGQAEKALACIDNLHQLQMEEPGLVVDHDLAMIWFSLGNADKGFYHLEQCINKRIGPAAIIMEHPMFKVPKEDARFRQLKEKLHLPADASV